MKASMMVSVMNKSMMSLSRWTGWVTALKAIKRGPLMEWQQASVTLCQQMA